MDESKAIGSARTSLMRRIKAWLVEFSLGLAAHYLRFLALVARAAGLGADAAHVEAAEGLPADDCAGAAPVEVEVADAETLPRFVEVRWLPRKHATRECELRIERDFEALGERPDSHDCQHRPKQLLLHQAVGRILDAKQRRRHEPTAIRHLAAIQQLRAIARRVRSAPK